MHKHTTNRRRRLSAGTGTAALSLSLCLCAGQLIATPAANAASTPVSQATTTVAKVKPSVRTTVSSRSIAWGAKVRITAHYYNPQTAKSVTSGTVRLQALRSGRWHTWASKALGSSGTVNLYAAPKVSGYFRTVYLGNSGYTSHTGAKVHVKVRVSGAKILAEAKAHKGALYKFAAVGPRRFDCSGFTLYVFEKAAGRKLPHRANSQQRYGKAVSKGKKRIGDLIIFRSGSYGYHAAIYAGNGYMYDSPHTGARVAKHKIYGRNYIVRRLVA